MKFEKIKCLNFIYIKMVESYYTSPSHFSLTFAVYVVNGMKVRRTWGVIVKVLCPYRVRHESLLQISQGRSVGRGKRDRSRVRVVGVPRMWATDRAPLSGARATLVPVSVSGRPRLSWVRRRGGQDGRHCLRVISGPRPERELGGRVDGEGPLPTYTVEETFRFYSLVFSLYIPFLKWVSCV